MKNKQELKYFYNLVRKIIKTKILSEREACDLTTLFMCTAEEYEGYGDDLYGKLLDLHIKLYPVSPCPIH